MQDDLRMVRKGWSKLGEGQDEVARSWLERLRKERGAVRGVAEQESEGWTWAGLWKASRWAWWRAMLVGNSIPGEPESREEEEE